MGGTRYYSRGIDDDGNVANFVETEQIMVIGSYLCSNIGLRGSVPVFWSQESMHSNIRLTRSAELTNTAFIKHFHALTNRYGKILCVNLMSRSKQSE